MALLKNYKEKVIVVGGGLSGSECAWQLAQAGLFVELYEMRPKKKSKIHKTDLLAELVCSNSLKSMDPESATGILKKELIEENSLLLDCALRTRVPAGKGLAVDRLKFSKMVTEKLESNKNIKILRKEVKRIPEGIVAIGTGPLTSPALEEELSKYVNFDLYFYDAIAPSVLRDSLDLVKMFWGSRYSEEKDYLNLPLTKEEYYKFVEELIKAEKVEPHPFEKKIFFEGCLPIEEMARRGQDTLAFGPLRPVGLKTDAYAVIQMRKEDSEGRVLNLVGFQTKLKYWEQKRILSSLPGFEKVKILRYGQVHRNTYINSPLHLSSDLSLKKHPRIFLMGQITGVEGYVECIATGLLCAKSIIFRLEGKPFFLPKKGTAFRALIDYLTKSNPKNFQPSNINFGILKRD
ncbi:MAG: methylenetetrahydrofolate--tRNA-(uracil(54)-C(5))-methyltransferase (FADH(2)-oxidizing) TrmFO [Thermoanaerobaculia bacterium]